MAGEESKQSLATLRNDVCQMGAFATTQFERALDSLAAGDEAAARAVIEADEQLNGMYLDIEDQCVQLFSSQEAFASDLRFITASFKISTDLERIGDLATNIAQYALAGNHDLVSDGTVDDIGREALSMLDRGLSAYETDDTEAARAVVESDERVDERCRTASQTVTRDLIEREADGDGPWLVEQLLDDVTRVLLTIRDIERVADHAVNIAARTVFAVENDRALIY